MDLQVIKIGELNISRRSQRKVCFYKPEAKWSTHGQVAKFFFEDLADRTCECCKILEWSVGRGDKPIKLSDSWFSAKYIEV